MKVAESEVLPSRGVIPKCPRFYQRAEGSSLAHCVAAGDPSLRLKNGSVQDDAIAMVVLVPLRRSAVFFEPV